jgi:hypothetical protein
MAVSLTPGYSVLYYYMQYLIRMNCKFMGVIIGIIHTGGISSEGELGG